MVVIFQMKYMHSPIESPVTLVALFLFSAAQSESLLHYCHLSDWLSFFQVEYMRQRAFIIYEKMCNLEFCEMAMREQFKSVTDFLKHIQVDILQVKLLKKFC